MTTLELAPPSTRAERRRAAAPQPLVRLPRGLGRVRRAVSGAILATVALAAVVGAVLVITLRIGFAPVLSPSMEPVFDPGDLVLTRPEPVAAVRVGQILELPIPNASNGTGSGDRYVHRVIAVTHNSAGDTIVRTKGDNNPAPDEWNLRITSHQVPRVVAEVPAVGRLSLLTRGAGLRIALILVVAGCALLGIKRALLDG